MLAEHDEDAWDQRAIGDDAQGGVVVFPAMNHQIVVQPRTVRVVATKVIGGEEEVASEKSRSSLGDVGSFTIREAGGICFRKQSYKSLRLACRGKALRFTEVAEDSRGGLLGDARNTHEQSFWIATHVSFIEPLLLGADSEFELLDQVSQRASMVKQLVDLKNQLIAYTNAVWPGVSRAFGDLDSAHARSFLREQRRKSVATLQVDRSFGLHSAEALISLVYLNCGGLTLERIH